MLFQPPFPEADVPGAITSIGVLYFLFCLMLMAFLLMHYAYKVAKDYSLILVAWVFSIDLGFGLLTSPDFPFIPFLPIIFMLWQTIMMILASLDFYKKKMREKEND